MRNFKRFLALMLTVLMVAGCFAIPTSAAASDRFDDVDTYVEAIDTLAAIGVVSGTSATTFNTDANVQRFQAALLFAKALTGKTDGNVWKTGVNNSVFADLDEDPQSLFVNAISYVNNNGIVTGKTATKFAPRDGITFEQGLTMAVRALGYETAAMKASATTGLWMYIDKAISLGLDAGLEDLVDYKANLTRGQMAQLIYNMLFVETADGYTYAAKAFNLLTETFVLTSTNTTKYDIGANIALAAPGYVGLTTLAADGSLGKTYYFEAETLKDLLGADSADFSGVVGYSYDVIADDTLSTIYSIDQNTVKVFENTLDATNFTIAANTGALTVDGKSYTVVDAYTKKLWNKNVKNTANTETLFYDWTEAESAKEGAYYYYDANGNIVSKDGKILMYLVANGGVSVSGLVSAAKTYMVKDETTGTYRLPTATDWANATYYMTTATGAKYYKQYDNNGEIKGFANVNLFGEIKAIDDDNDGNYDRMFYTQYKFGKYTESTESGKIYVTVKGANGEVYVNHVLKNNITYKGKAVANGNWIVFAYNNQLPEIIVKDVIGSQVGYVNGFSVANSTITIDGVAYAINNLQLVGIANIRTILGLNNDKDWADATDDFIGRYVTYYKIGNTVVVLDNANTSKYVVFDGIVTVSADNAITVKAYVESNTASVINVVSLNGYPLSTFGLNGYNSTLNYVYSTLLAMERGTILTTAVDANGNYHLYDYKLLDGDDKEYVTDNNNNKTATIEFIQNGIAVVDSTNTFYANANTTFVFARSGMNEDYLGKSAEGVIGTFKGIPAAGSKIEDARMIVVKYGNYLGTFVYVLDGTLSGSFTQTEYNTIVYIDKNETKLANQFADQFTGTEWTYTRAVDLATGTYTTVKSASARLYAGKFYAVKDGFAISEYVPVATKVTSLGKTFLGNTFISGAVTTDTITDGALNAVFAMNANGVVVDGAHNIINYYTAANVNAFANADLYWNAYVVPVTVNGVQKYTVIKLSDGSYKADVAAKYAALLTVEEGKGVKVAAGAADTTGTFVFTSTAKDRENAMINSTTIENGKELVGDSVKSWAGKSFTVSGSANVVVTVSVKDIASNGVEVTVPVVTYTVK